jgi:hypothetical protein
MPEQNLHLKMGIWRHYKGELYQVIGLAHDANHDDRTVVVYMPLQLNAAHLGPRMAVRTIEDFAAIVHVNRIRDNWSTCSGPSTCPETHFNSGVMDQGHYLEIHRKRFDFLGPVLTSAMMQGQIEDAAL